MDFPLFEDYFQMQKSINMLTRARNLTFELALLFIILDDTNLFEDKSSTSQNKRESALFIIAPGMKIKTHRFILLSSTNLF